MFIASESFFGNALEHMCLTSNLGGIILKLSPRLSILLILEDN